MRLKFLFVIICLLFAVNFVSAAITTCQQLQDMELDKAGDYVLGGDIVCTGFDYGDEKGFMPIGSYASKFIGSLDGQGYKITNLFINRSTNSVGLIGYTLRGKIKNVGLENVDITGNSAVGGLVGSNKIGKITNCSVTGNINSNLGVVGGLVGYNNYGTINNSYSTGNVYDDHGQKAGGLVGWNYGEITNSYSTSDVIGYTYVGGLVGYNEGSTIEASYSTGAVNGNGGIGGLVGQNRYSTITNSYSTSHVTGTGGAVAGLVGSHHSGNIINSYSAGIVSASGISIGGFAGGTLTLICANCFWDKDTSGQDLSVCGIGKTIEQMKQKGTFTTWNFSTVWGIESGDYPRLIWELCSDGTKNQDETNTDCGGFICLPCIAGKTCVIDDDCESNNCSGGICGSAGALSGETSDIRAEFNIAGCDDLLLGECSSDGDYYCDDTGRLWNTLNDSYDCYLWEDCCPLTYSCYDVSGKCVQRTTDCTVYTDDSQSTCEDNGCYWLDTYDECVDSNDPRLTCSIYENNETCDDDDWGLAGAGEECVWDNGVDGECKLSYNVSIYVYDDLNNIVGIARCLKSFTVGVCDEGEQEVSWITALDPSLLPNQIAPDCEDGSETKICGQPIVKLPGFNWINIIAVVFLIGLFYLVFGRREHC